MNGSPELRHGRGQGPVEVLAVLGLLGTLVAVATPAYLSYQARKADRTAQRHLVAALPAAEAYRRSHGSYAGLDTVDLLRIDPRIPLTLSVASARRGRYCLTDTVHGRTWSLRGPVRGKPKLHAGARCA
ncbi:MAG TPA: hypothetical protein VNK94_08355 [Gaiellaceae bacterium]|jgi:type II secretory pathway pseudopilin PulG|nr:hypothetical protein [Gaiellaceae bacterium]